MEHFTLLEYFLGLVVLVIIGLSAGFMGAFFGVGGGTIFVPFFLMVFAPLTENRSITMHQAVGTSLALVILNATMAALKNYKAGHLHVTYFRGWALWLCLGSIIGGLLTAYVSSFFLLILYTGYLVAAIIYGLTEKKVVHHHHQTEGISLPTGSVKITAAMIFGGLSVMLGNAGGAFTTPFFSFYRYPLRKAIAMSLAGGVVISFIGTLSSILSGLFVSGRLPFSLGYVNIVTVILVAPFVLLSSPWGVSIARHTPDKLLKKLYLIFLSVLATYMIVQLATGWYE